MGYDGTAAQTAAFIAALIIWYWCILHRIHPLVKLLSYLQVAMPLWHVINGEQHASDGAWGGVDSYEVTLAYCSVMYCIVLWYARVNRWWLYVVVAAALIGILYTTNGWHGIAVAEVSFGIVAWLVLIKLSFSVRG